MILWLLMAMMYWLMIWYINNNFISEYMDGFIERILLQKNNSLRKVCKLYISNIILQLLF